MLIGLFRYFWILESVHFIPRDQHKVVLYINKYIDSDQLNKLFNFDLMNKAIKKRNGIAYKLEPISIRETHKRLEIAKEKRQKKRDERKAEHRNYDRKTG